MPYGSSLLWGAAAGPRQGTWQVVGTMAVRGIGVFRREKIELGSMNEVISGIDG